jgi:hypothetical protein
MASVKNIGQESERTTHAQFVINDKITAQKISANVYRACALNKWL